MRYFLLMIAVVALVGCASIDPIVEEAIRSPDLLNKPTGKLTKADFEKVTILFLRDKQLTDVPKGLEKLTKLKLLFLGNNKLTSVKGLEKLT